MYFNKYCKDTNLHLRYTNKDEGWLFEKFILFTNFCTYQYQISVNEDTPVPEYTSHKVNFITPLVLHLMNHGTAFDRSIAFYENTE